MSPQIADPNVQALLMISATLQAHYAAADLAWSESPFAWIKTRSSRQRGTIGEKLVAGWLAAEGCRVAPSDHSDADRIINGKRAEIKFSTLWAKGFYQFQQLRDQNYDFAICLGVSPFDVHCWAIPKTVIMQHWGGVEIRPQHLGQKGTDTQWLKVTVGKQPAWLQGFGGSLDSALLKIREITGS